MERDFMGLNPYKDATVKEEVVQGVVEQSGFARSSGPANKASGLPQFMSSRCKQEKLSKNGQPAYSMSPFSMKPQFLGGSTHAGVTEQWINSKASNAPAQMTIFYGGKVCVFDDISPEKAQAIMLLAGNVYAQSMMTQSKLHMQAPASKAPAVDQPLANQSMSTPPCSGLPSPMSVSSHPIGHCGVPGTNIDDIKVSKTAGMSPALANNTEPSRVMSSVAASAIMSSAVPQARKASLARFLEKRKERVVSAAAPYNQGKKTADCKMPESNDFGFSATSTFSSSVTECNM
ncbi:protein TIFY 7-like isoform X2 [Salvia splendens]|uniref:protein TIFY 7-like isoform X2 n=1 Tax=Salvia splendens TaxID=180675 RepID=UPI001C279E89|nr:protein TIFY 7-like isoform X2 [Salvia splendens]